MHLSSDESASQLESGLHHAHRGQRRDGGKSAAGGFDLRTDGDGVARAARGMLITTEARPNAQSHAKDMGETDPASDAGV